MACGGSGAPGGRFGTMGENFGDHFASKSSDLGGTSEGVSEMFLKKFKISLLQMMLPTL